MQILAGKRLVTFAGADVRIKGKDVFRDSPPGITFLGTEWFVRIDSIFEYASARLNMRLRAMNPVIRNDIEVSHFLDSVGATGSYDKERRDQLLDILDVDLSWRMHQVIADPAPPIAS